MPVIAVQEWPIKYCIILPAIAVQKDHVSKSAYEQVMRSLSDKKELMSDVSDKKEWKRKLSDKNETLQTTALWKLHRMTTCRRGFSLNTQTLTPEIATQDDDLSKRDCIGRVTGPAKKLEKQLASREACLICVCVWEVISRAFF